MDHVPDSVAALVDDLTRQEKLSLVRGAEDPEGRATGYLPGVERLDVPPFRLVDGPLGVRAEGERATAFPASIALAATFDPALAREQGRAMAREATAHGQHALLAPGVNLVRVPHCGRNFEYYGEDPHLAGALAAGTVEGIQGEDVVATVKHFVANNQETARTTVSADVSERALRELYLPAFRDAVEAGADSVMTAYNRINGVHASDHDYLLSDVLRGEWGFEGYVVSDWYGLESTVGAANAGLDLEMPGVAPPGGPEDGPDVGDLDGLPDPHTAGRFGDALSDAVDRGAVPEARLDDMVARVLGAMDGIGLLDGERPEGALDTDEHRDLAERIAARGTVMLKNDGVLPLAPDDSVAVVGPNHDEPTLGGGGSSETTPFVSTSPVAGVRERANGDVTAARGAPPVEGVSLFDRLPGFDAGRETDAADDDGPEPSIGAAVAAAEGADAAVVVVRDAATESLDRDSLSLPGVQDALVRAVADAAERTVVVVNAGGPVELPWRDAVDAVLVPWYPGQADGDALAAVLYGDRDPGGRLPVTFAPEGTYPTDGDERRFPGVDDVAHYDEGVFVGYRGFDAAAVAPTYPFGHGESYAAFAYGDLEVVGDHRVAVRVENEGDRAGREVIQAYAEPPDPPAGVERPPRELAGVATVALDPGEERTVELSLDERAIGRYDAEEGAWVTDDGALTVAVGRSSRDLRATVTLG